MGLFDSLKKAATDTLGSSVSNATKNIVTNAAKNVTSNVAKAANSAASAKATPKNEAKTFTFNSLPKTVDELKALPEACLDSPYKAAALTVCALCEFPSNREASIEMLNFLKGPQPLSPKEIQFIADRFMDGKNYIPVSYFAGTSPENDYTPAVPYKITVSSNPYSFQDENYATLFIKSSGADNERQVKMRRKGDQWFLWEQFLLPGIRQPKSSDPWA